MSVSSQLNLNSKLKSKNKKEKKKEIKKKKILTCGSAESARPAQPSHIAGPAISPRARESVSITAWRAPQSVPRSSARLRVGPGNQFFPSTP
jgi:hypothetical protein